MLIPVAVSDMIERLEKTHSILDWLFDNLPQFEFLPEAVTQTQLSTMARINMIFLEECGLYSFCSESGSFLTQLQYNTNPLHS